MLNSLKFNFLDVIEAKVYCYPDPRFRVVDIARRLLIYDISGHFEPIFFYALRHVSEIRGF